MLVLRRGLWLLIAAAVGLLCADSVKTSPPLTVALEARCVALASPAPQTVLTAGACASLCAASAGFQLRVLLETSKIACECLAADACCPLSTVSAEYGSVVYQNDGADVASSCSLTYTNLLWVSETDMPHPMSIWFRKLYFPQFYSVTSPVVDLRLSLLPSEVAGPNAIDGNGVAYSFYTDWGISGGVTLLVMFSTPADTRHYVDYYTVASVASTITVYSYAGYDHNLITTSYASYPASSGKCVTSLPNHQLTVYGDYTQYVPCSALCGGSNAYMRLTSAAFPSVNLLNRDDSCYSYAPTEWFMVAEPCAFDACANASVVTVETEEVDTTLALDIDLQTSLVNDALGVIYGGAAVLQHIDNYLVAETARGGVAWVVARAIYIRASSRSKKYIMTDHAAVFAFVPISINQTHARWVAELTSYTPASADRLSSAPNVSCSAPDERDATYSSLCIDETSTVYSYSTVVTFNAGERCPVLEESVMSCTDWAFSNLESHWDTFSIAYTVVYLTITSAVFAFDVIWFVIKSKPLYFYMSQKGPHFEDPFSLQAAPLSLSSSSRSKKGNDLGSTFAQKCSASLYVSLHKQCIACKFCRSFFSFVRRRLLIRVDLMA